MTDHEKKIMKVKIQLQNSHPFLSYLLMHMNISPREGIPTLCVTNTGKLYYNPEYVDTLTLAKAKSALAHEALHMVLGHVFRCTKWYAEYRDLLNRCADIIVNGLLIKEGFEMDEHWILPDSNGDLVYLDKHGKTKVIQNVAEKESLESLFHKLLDDLPKQKMACRGQCKGGSGQGDGQSGGGSSDSDNEGGEQGSGGGGDSPIKGDRIDEHRYEKDDSTKKQPDKPGDISEEWKFRVTEAASMAKQRGKLSGSMSSAIKFLTEPQIDWRTKLARFLVAAMPSNTTWNRPSRRSRALGVYLPSTKKDEHVDAVIHVDTSGSISEKELCMFLSEVTGILASYDSVDLHLIQCDAQIQSVEKMSRQNGDQFKEGYKFKGRGGTSHIPVVDWVNENTTGRTLLISCTDGYSDVDRCYPKLKDDCYKMFVVVGDAYSTELHQYGEVLCLKKGSR